MSPLWNFCGRRKRLRSGEEDTSRVCSEVETYQRRDERVIPEGEKVLIGELKIRTSVGKKGTGKNGSY